MGETRPALRNPAQSYSMRATSASRPLVGATIREFSVPSSSGRAEGAV